MRRRNILLAILSLCAMLPTGCMMMDQFDDEGNHEVEYRREMPRQMEKPDTVRGAYGGTE